MGKIGGGKRRFTNPLHAAASSTAQQMLMKPALRAVLDIHVHGIDNLEKVQEPFIAIANHSSHFDAPLIMSFLPQNLSRRLATGAAADTFFTKRSKAIAIELLMNAYPINRGSTRDHRGLSKQLLSKGVPLFIFPEGTRSRTGAMGPFNPGTAALAISFNCQVVPAALIGSFAAWPANQPRWNPGRPKVHLTFGLPMRPRPGEIAHEFSERMRRKVMEMHDSTATAYGMPTQVQLARIAAIQQKEKDDRQKPGGPTPAI